MAIFLEAEIETPLVEGFNPKAQGLIKQFLASKKAKGLEYKLSQASLAGIDLSFFQAEIAGEYFENLAYFYLLDHHQIKDNLFLSPTETKRLFQRLYPKQNLYTFRDDEHQSLGIPEPDGLLFRIGKNYLQLMGTYEYTLCYPERSFQKQEQFKSYSAENMGRLLGIFDFKPNDGLPPFSPTLGEKLHLVCSRAPILPVNLAEGYSINCITPEPDNSTSEKEKKIPHLPFNRLQFSWFISDLINQIKESTKFNTQF